MVGANELIAAARSLHLAAAENGEELCLMPRNLRATRAANGSCRGDWMLAGWLGVLFLQKGSRNLKLV